MKDIKLICPECKKSLTLSRDRIRCSSGHIFQKRINIYNILPDSLSDITKSDADYHAEQKDSWIEQNQINSIRNRYFHRKIINFVSKRCKDHSNILEIGGGVGFDLGLFLEKRPKFKNYVFSEISEDMLSYVSKRMVHNDVVFCSIDVQNIPFADRQFDMVFMIAALHHFGNIKRALDEIKRVTKKGGYVIFGIEPNKKMFKFLSSMKNLFGILLPSKNHSPADEEAEGFTKKTLLNIQKRHNLKLLKLEPVWFFSGFLHYGLEFLHRLFRMKNRIMVPDFIDKWVIELDKLLFCIPGFNNFSWHYTVIYEKNEKINNIHCNI